MMKKNILLLLILMTIPGLLFASTYGKPYGSNDDTVIEKDDVKTIDQINRSTIFDDVQEPVEQEEEPVVPELEPSSDARESVPDPEEATIENEQPPAEEQEPAAQ
ncbi:MAG TPA: hypothetical protein VJ974_03425 [Geopsychrobacteraceae bacterium]|nr:hypothetical protein [Geopsychrobacteraceae bacterium]